MPDSLPLAASMKDAVRLSGLSQTDLHALLRAGTIEARKRDRTTLVMMDSVRRYLDSLPKATFGAGVSKEGGDKLKRSKRAA